MKNTRTVIVTGALPAGLLPPKWKQVYKPRPAEFEDVEALLKSGTLHLHTGSAFVRSNQVFQTMVSAGVDLIDPSDIQPDQFKVLTGERISILTVTPRGDRPAAWTWTMTVYEAK